MLIAASQADVHAPARQLIEGGDLLGDHERVVEGNHDDGRAHAEPRGLGRDERGELRGPREIAVGREVMLGEPDIAEGERLGGLGDVDGPRIDLLGRARGGRLHQQERSELDGHAYLARVL